MAIEKRGKAGVGVASLCGPVVLCCSTNPLFFMFMCNGRGPVVLLC